jgi:RNase P subunit RPR2
MSIDCYCGYDTPKVHSSRLVRARKQYKCEECSAPIFIGENHEYVFAVYDEGADQFRTCSHCVDMRRFVANSVPCFCWCHGSLIDDCKATIEDAYDRAGDEVKGLWFGFARRLIKARRARIEKAKRSPHFLYAQIQV